MSGNISLGQKWIETARWAASGGNAQPWNVELEERENQIAIQLSIDPAYFPKHSPLDVRGTAAALSLGCLATNLIALAALDSYALVEETFKPGESHWKSFALLIFEKTARCETKFPLETILDRHSNRYPFSTQAIPDSLKKAISEISDHHPKLLLREFVDDKRSLIQGLEKLEAIRWYAKSYFQSMLSEFSFQTPIEKEPDKIPVSQLGIAFPDQLLLRAFYRWPGLHRILRPLLVLIGPKKALLNFLKNCDRVYLLQAQSNAFESCFELGKAFQEIWLECQRHGLAFQPLGIPLVALGFWQKEPDLGLEPFQERDIQNATEKIQERFSINLKLPVMGFRVGYPTAKTARAPRKELKAKLGTKLIASS